MKVIFHSVYILYEFVKFEFFNLKMNTPPTDLWLGSKCYKNPVLGGTYTLWHIRIGDNQYDNIVLKVLLIHKKTINGNLDTVREMLKTMLSMQS